MRMQRATPYLGIVVALLLAALITTFPGKVANSPVSPAVSHTASSTLAVVPSLAVPAITLPNIESTLIASTASIIGTPKKTVQPMTKPAPVSAASSSPAMQTIPALVTPVPTPLISSGNSALDAAATALRAALVNIVCYVPATSTLHSISGSGVIIDPKGIILTNAHIAQYFLLADRGVSCIIRSGSPAVDNYSAALIYISPIWLHANARVLTQTAPSGTGEYDFALLAITKRTAAAALPSAFPSLPLAIMPPDSGTPVVIASYGAQFLEANQIQSALFPTVVFGSVKDVYTFGTNTIDVLALGGSAAAQEGSSGGGIVDASGSLVGTITTSTTQGTTDTRSLDAITASYIRAEYATEMGSAIDFLLAESPSTAVSDFAPKIPTLEAIITAQLP